MTMKKIISGMLAFVMAVGTVVMPMTITVEADAPYDLQYDVYYSIKDKIEAAKTTTNNNFKYSFNDDGTVIIIRYVGDDKNKNVAIPSQIDGKKVTVIGYGAFTGMGINSVVIPEGVTQIGEYAFCECCNLKSVNIPKSVTQIALYAFSDTPWLEEKQKENPLVIVNDILIDGTTAEGKVTVPKQVKYLGAGAFKSNYNINSVTIAKGITEIPKDCFYSCTNLRKVIIPKSVTTILNRSFEDCNKLETINLPEGLTTIGSYAFCNTSKLKKVVFPESIEKIGEYAYRASGVEVVSIPANFVDFKPYTFEFTPWLNKKREENPLVIINNVLIDGYTAKGAVVIPNEVNSITPYDFYNNYDMTSVVISNNIKELPAVCFAGCTSLRTVVLPNSIREIPEKCFSYCYNLTNINLPPNVTIHKQAFDTNLLLKNVILHDTVKEVYTGAYVSCDLDTLTIWNDDIMLDDIFYSQKVDTIIQGNKDSNAEKYAAKHNLKFKVVKKFEECNVSIKKSTCRYNGKAQTPEIVVKDGDTILRKSKDYTVKYKDNTEIGTATITVEGIGKYVGTVKLTFTIK